MNNSSKIYLNNAIELLSSNSHQSDKYACLELRQCLETLAYQKIKAYKDRIPDSIISQWRPAQAMKMLEELEPSSITNKDINIKLIMNKNILNKKFIQNEITSSFIRKYYHKLGSYLHAPFKEKNNKSNLHIDLVKLIEKIKPFVDNEIYSSISKVIKFKCDVCKKEFIRNANSINNGDIITCFNDDCKAEYIVEEKKDNRHNLNVAIIECVCGFETSVANHELRNDKYLFTCKKCKSKYTIIKAYKMERINE